MTDQVRAYYKPKDVDYAIDELALEGKGKNPVDDKQFDARTMNDMCFTIGEPLRENGGFEEREKSTRAMAMLFVQHRLGKVEVDKDSLALMNATLAKAKEFGYVKLDGKYKSMGGSHAWTHAVECCADICGATVPEVLEAGSDKARISFSYNKVDRLAEAKFV